MSGPWDFGWNPMDPGHLAYRRGYGHPVDGRRFLARHDNGRVQIVRAVLVDDSGTHVAEPEYWMELPK
jgi:hypothetical protein